MASQAPIFPSPVTFVGPLPPPVTGMTAMTEHVVEALRKQGPVTCFNWSRDKPLKGIRWKLARAWGVCKSLWGLLVRGRRQGDALYYPANSGWGMIYDMAIVSLARIMGYRVVLHHHVYSYLDQYDRRMALLNRLLGDSGAHVVHCEKMRRDFLSQYKTNAEFLFVPPTIVSCSQEKKQPTRNAHAANSPFVLGFLSNLTLVKGLKEVLETFEALVSRGCPVRLVLAGPCMQKEALRLIEQAKKRWPELVEYRGPVYGEQKALFFSEIDTFLFPTQYKNESWGIVLTESLAVGRPVIAYDRGCISHIVRGGCGLVVPKNDHFALAASEQIELWVANPGLYLQARQQAFQRNEELESEAEEQLTAFVREIRKRPLS